MKNEFIEFVKALMAAAPDVKMSDQLILKHCVQLM